MNIEHRPADPTPLAQVEIVDYIAELGESLTATTTVSYCLSYIGCLTRLARPVWGLWALCTTLCLNTGGIPGSRYWRGLIPKYRY